MVCPMVVAREDFNALIARAFDGAVIVDGARVVAHKSGMHVVRDGQRAIVIPKPRPLDRENDWSDV